ncbi:light-mediated development protein DET1 isoform X2 [Carica papaya]|uniref:light-mediated development protein DET1 isoform X2 n=1 Tax=Carica papaya TaxID=3649 RepID=UPI000B8CE207|nr:light-mediated development protein DET1 isoform X2 [Carica papaya]
MESNQFGLFATSTAQIHDAPATGGAVQGVPFIEKITFHLLRLENGVILDEKVFHNDFVNLGHNMSVFLYEDLLAIVSLRYQMIHILQIRDSGHLVDVRAIGTFCREDDELFLNSNTQFMVAPERNRVQQFPGNRGDHMENGLRNDQPNADNLFLSGIKQRLLSFIFREIWNEETDQTLVSRNADHHPAFFAVYNMETTEIVAFYQNSADELYLLFEQYCDHFHAASGNSLHMHFISTHSNNVHALEQLRCIKNKAGSFTQFVKKILASLPFSCQSQSPSPYFDQSLFRFDEKVTCGTR